jgi:hypothetical protein
MELGRKIPHKLCLAAYRTDLIMFKIAFASALLVITSGMLAQTRTQHRRP